MLILRINTLKLKRLKKGETRSDNKSAAESDIGYKTV
jgi:hypothetical protein